MMAEATVSDFSNQLTARAASAAVDLKKDGLEGSELQTGIEAALEAQPDGWIDLAGDEAARQAIFGGRYQSLLELDNEIDRVVRIEGNYGTPRICPPCEDGHGDEWPSLAEVDWSRGDDCEGGDACAGDLWVDWMG
jgi:hypothetical protein